MEVSWFQPTLHLGICLTDNMKIQQDHCYNFTRKKIYVSLQFLPFDNIWIRAHPPPEVRGGSRGIPRPDEIYNLSSVFRVFPGVSSHLHILDKMSEQMIYSPQELPDILSPDIPLISCQSKSIWYKHEAKKSELNSKAVKFKCFTFYFTVDKWLGILNGTPISKSISVIKMKEMVSLVSREDQTQMWCHGNRTNSGLLKGLI